MKKTDYKPVDCSLHDTYEHHITLKTRLSISYLINDIEHTVQSRIKEIYTREGEEFMVINEGDTVRLDKVLSIKPISELI